MEGSREPATNSITATLLAGFPQWLLAHGTLYIRPGASVARGVNGN